MTLTDFLRLLGISTITIPLSCLSAGCGGEGGYTLTDFHKDNTEYGVRWKGKLRAGNEGEFYTKQSAGVKSPFEFEGEADNYSAFDRELFPLAQKKKVMSNEMEPAIIEEGDE